MNNATWSMVLCCFMTTSNLMLAGCQSGPEEEADSIGLELATKGKPRTNGSPGRSGDCKLRAHLDGDEEVPPRPTNAQGQVLFRFNADETELSYKLIVANIDNVIAAHIHVGARGVNGPVVALLAGPFDAGGGPTNGILAQGTITAEDLEGPLAGASLSALAAAMRAGNTYVNVHTDDSVPPANTGPGDFPGGEIRGQIEPIGGCR